MTSLSVLKLQKIIKNYEALQKTLKKKENRTAKSNSKTKKKSLKLKTNFKIKKSI